MSAISAQRLKGPMAFLDVIYQHVHRMLKSRHIKDWCARSWTMVVQFGTPQVYFWTWEGTEKGSYICNRQLHLWNWEHDWHSRTTKMGNSEKGRRDSRIIMLYKVPKDAASIHTNDLVPPVGMSEIITLWHCKPPLLILTFTRAISFPGY